MLSRHRRDLGVLFVNRVLRGFAFGTSAVLLSLFLQAKGLTSAQIGVVLALGIGAAAVAGIVLARTASRVGRRRTLAATGLLMALSGVDMALADPFWLLALGALTGMLGGAALDVGPFLAVEQAVLSDTTQPANRNRAFARYSLSGALAWGAGAAAVGFAGGPAAGRAFYLAYAAVGVVTAALPLLLSRGLDGQLRQPAFGNLRPLLGLSALLATDSLGGGFTVQAVLVYWLHVRYGSPVAVLGPAFALMSLLGAASYEVSGRLSERIGLIRTMVFTHVPADLILLLVPFAPNQGVALALLILRSAISSMDIPARQAYVVSIVPPAQRAGAVAVTSAARGFAQAAGPFVSGLAIQASVMALPLFLSGGLKLLYDAGLYAGFRSRHAEHEKGGRDPG